MGASQLETLTEAIDDLLALDPAELEDGQLHDTVIGLVRQSHRLAAARAALVGAWERRRVWAGDGSRSPGHRLAREASMSVKEAVAKRGRQADGTSPDLRHRVLQVRCRTLNRQLVSGFHHWHPRPSTDQHVPAAA